MIEQVFWVICKNVCEVLDDGDVEHVVSMGITIKSEKTCLTKYARLGLLIWIGKTSVDIIVAYHISLTLINRLSHYHGQGA